MNDKPQRKSVVATRRGDDGTTGLLFGGERIWKNDDRTEAYGDVDEAVACLGVARAEVGHKAQYGVLPHGLGHLGDLLLRLQRELFVAGADLATAPGSRDRQRPGETRVTGTMVEGLDGILAEMERAIDLPTEFVIPGQSRLSAAIEVARTVVRRAERRAVAFRRLEPVEDDHVVPYLNRLADLLWVLARAAEQAESKESVPSRHTRRTNLENEP